MPKDQIDPVMETMKINNELKTFHQLRKDRYERIIQETLFVATASEGAISAEWLMEQPIFIRTKYVEQLDKEIKERKNKMSKKKKK